MMNGQQMGAPEIEKRQDPIPDYSVRKILLKLRKIGINSACVAAAIDVSHTCIYNYTKKRDVQPTLKNGLAIINVGIVRLSALELRDCIDED